MLQAIRRPGGEITTVGGWLFWSWWRWKTPSIQPSGITEGLHYGVILGYHNISCGWYLEDISLIYDIKEGCYSGNGLGVNSVSSFLERFIRWHPAIRFTYGYPWRHSTRGDTLAILYQRKLKRDVEGWSMGLLLTIRRQSYWCWQGDGFKRLLWCESLWNHQTFSEVSGGVYLATSLRAAETDNSESYQSNVCFEPTNGEYERAVF